MKKLILCLLLSSTSALAELDKAQLDLFKKESGALRSAVNDIVNANSGGLGVAGSAKATYLDGYGMVLTLEAALEPTRNPFSSPKTPTEVREIVAERRRAIETKLDALLKERIGVLRSIAPTDSVTVVLYLFNSNPLDIPDLPSQISFTIKKQDPSQVVRRAF